jgi:hypothetical protein
MAKDTLTLNSPWMKALSLTDEGDEEQQSQDPGGIGADAEARAQAIPQPVQPQHRIDDANTAGIKRGGSPQSSTGPSDSSGFYDPAQWHGQDPARLPLEQNITTDRAALDRMNNPTKATLKQRIMGGIGAGLQGAALGWQGKNDVGATLRDRAEARQVQEKEDLANRIATNTRALSQETMQEEGQNLRARLAAQAQVAAAQRLGETLASRERNVDTQQAGAGARTAAAQAGATGRTQMVQAGENQRFAQGQQDKLTMFKGSQDYLRWKTQLDDDTKMRVAELQRQATQNKAPAALMQTAVFSKGGLDRLNSADAAMQRLQASGVMGTSWGQNKVEDWIFGKGAVDPNLTPQQRQDIGQLRAALGYTSSAAMRAHTGRTSQEIYQDFKKTLGPGQDWDALRGAMGETRDMLTDYAGAASDANIANIRAGGGTGNPKPPAKRPPGVPASAVQGPDGHWRLPQ